jgi:hypothetical protein
LNGRKGYTGVEELLQLVGRGDELGLVEQDGEDRKEALFELTDRRSLHDA